MAFASLNRVSPPSAEQSTTESENEATAERTSQPAAAPQTTTQDSSTQLNLSKTSIPNNSHPLPSMHAHSTPQRHPPQPATTATPPTKNQTQYQLSINPALAKLQTQISTLQTKLSTATAQLSSTTSQLSSPDSAPAEQTVKRHIALLHRYNETRDVGMGLLGMIAEQRGVRLREVLTEWGVEGAD